MAYQRTWVIAAGAGLASALLFAASAQGAGPSLILAYVTPLPIMIATLGFGQATGLVAAAVAACGLAFYLGLLPGLFFALLLGVPSWLLPYLTLLARPLVPPVQGQPGLVLWYPIGRVVAWAAAIVAGVILAVGGLLILRSGGFEPAVTYFAGRLDTIVGQGPSEELAGATTARRVVQVLPVLMAASAFVMLMVNLWLAARIVERSGLLRRPWPSLPENYHLPKITVAVLVVAGAAAFAGGAPRVAGGVVAAAFGMAFVVQGLAAAHALTRGLAARPMILLAIYIITVAIVPSLIALAVVGIVDCLMPFRPRQQPSTPPVSRS